MTSRSPFNRSDFVRQQRSSRKNSPSRRSKSVSTTRRAYESKTLYLPMEPRLRREPQPARRTRQAKGSSQTQRYNIAFSLGRTSVRAPALSLPRFDFSNPRWITGLATIFFAAFLYILWASSSFTVVKPDVRGNQRIDSSEIGGMLGILGEPIFKAVPAQIEENLRTAYPDLSGVSVSARLPNRIIVKVIERTPLIAWFQNGAMTWIDENGNAFQPRGEVSGLVQVSANGAPRQDLTDPALNIYEQRFITPELVQVIISLAPFVPTGVPMIYDPQYGIGWQDPSGWVVHFGQNTQDMDMKFTVYHALVDRLVSQGIQPTLISMEFLDAPFYK